MDSGEPHNPKMKSPKEEWQTYSFISKLLLMFALAMSNSTTTIGLVPQFNLIPNQAIPNFGAYLQHMDVNPFMGLVWEAKPLAGLKDYRDLGVYVSDVWTKANFLAEASLTKHYDPIKSYVS